MHISKLFSRINYANMFSSYLRKLKQNTHTNILKTEFENLLPSVSTLLKKKKKKKKAYIWPTAGNAHIVNHSLEFIDDRSKTNIF